MDYHSRLSKINENINHREIIDSIDRPIRPLVIELYRIGLRTKFSCCGFNYNGEEEPKTHAKQKSYVHVYDPDMKCPLTVSNFFNMSALAIKWGWSVFRFADVWDVSFKVPQGMSKFYDTADGIPEAIHDYEANVIAIYNLINTLKQLPTVCKEFVIVDGNSVYKDLTEWQIKPKQSTTIKMII